MRRRDFIAGLGAAASTWPSATHAQHVRRPLVGFLYAGSPAGVANLRRPYLDGLAETGHIDGQNVTVDFSFAEGRYDQLPAMIDGLLQRRASVLVPLGNAAAAVAAKAATTFVPIVFAIGDDPTRFGLVASLARPGGNVTGINFFQAELGAKRLGLLRELLPKARRVGLLVNPTNAGAEMLTKDVTLAAPQLGMEIDVLHVSEDGDIDTAFEHLTRNHADAMLTTPDSFLISRREKLAMLAARYAIPVVYSAREYAAAGGLMTYGSSLTDAYRQTGVYTGRVLNGEKPADLPVLQPTKFELAINLKTAKALGVEIPATLLARADEVIE